MTDQLREAIAALSPAGLKRLAETLHEKPFATVTQVVGALRGLSEDVRGSVLRAMGARQTGDGTHRGWAKDQPIAEWRRSDKGGAWLWSVGRAWVAAPRGEAEARAMAERMAIVALCAEEAEGKPQAGIACVYCGEAGNFGMRGDKHAPVLCRDALRAQLATETARVCIHCAAQPSDTRPRECGGGSGGHLDLTAREAAVMHAEIVRLLEERIGREERQSLWLCSERDRLAERVGELEAPLPSPEDFAAINETADSWGDR